MPVLFLEENYENENNARPTRNAIRTCVIKNTGLSPLAL